MCKHGAWYSQMYVFSLNNRQARTGSYDSVAHLFLSVQAHDMSRCHNNGQTNNSNYRSYRLLLRTSYCTK